MKICTFLWAILVLTTHYETVAALDKIQVNLTTLKTAYYLEGHFLTRTFIVHPSEDTLDKHVNGQPLDDIVVKDQNLPFLPKNFVANMPEVSSVTIEYSGLKEIEAGSFRNMTRLWHLELNHNEIEVIRNETFSGLDSGFLDRWLDLSNNKISVIENKAFNNLKISHIKLDNNRISIWNGDWFTGSPVNSVTIAHNLLEEIPANSFGYFKNLSDQGHNFWYFIANDNKIEKIRAGAFAGIKDFGYLNLQNNSIGVIEAGAFEGVKDLNNLELNNNSISEIGESVFRGVKLTYVKLQHNNISCISPGEFPVYSINFNDNPFTCDCVTKWEQHNGQKVVDLSVLKENCVTVI